MHINRNKINSHLTELEEMHLKHCKQCQDEQALLDELTFDVKNMDWVEAPNECWQMLQKTIDQQNQSKNQNWFLSVGVAASIFLTGFIWLMWSNYQLQQQFEYVLVINQQLESQLMTGVSPSYQQAALVTDIHRIEELLSASKSEKEKLNLLKKRQKVFNQLIKLQQGEQNEFYI